MMDSPTPIRPKFGVPPSPQDKDIFEPRPFHYPNLFDVQEIKGPQRIVLAPAARHIDLLLALLAELAEPFGILYVLLLSRLGKAEPGRYQSPQPVGRIILNNSVRDFETF